ncbi:MAG: dihydrolipoyl dehydrogenase [Dehalococcoidia bacterium]|nr:dihydrolipoyl dehydrogenase [Dehalococcoidia bacterium]
MTERKDIIIIGAGPGGYVAAIRARQFGKSVALIEGDQLGGICLNRGCIPSKALLSVTRLLSRVRQANRYGVDLSVNGVDIAKLDEWKNGIVKRTRDGLRFLMTSNKVDIIPGMAKLLDSKTVGVKSADGTEKLVQADNIIIATGSSPRLVPGLAFDGKRVLSPEQVMADISIAPSKIVILGGGVIAAELAGICRSLGGRVTLVVRSEVLRRFDKDIRSICVSSLRSAGVEIVTGAELENVEDSGNSFRLRFKQANQSLSIEADRVIVAVGRIPNTSGLGLKETGVTLDSGGCIAVNDKKQTSVPGIYAIGDVIGAPLLAHKASAEGKYAAELISGAAARLPRYIPHVVFSACEAASVGLTEDEARAQTDVKIGYFPFPALGAAIASDNTSGFVKLIADPSNDRIMGVHVAGEGAAELIGQAVLALEAGVKVSDFAGVMRPHPTISEAFTEAALDVYSEAMHFFRAQKRAN